MKTTIDIPENELKEAIKHTGAKTKRDAVVYALIDFNKRRRMAKLTRILGTFQDFMDQNDLKIMREDERWEKRCAKGC
ncbi:MAG: type II toxin-antitoxin system VapB family antitoxin [Nitrospinae bacterium]|nr:type II toxin-antitoxin system VapB family antitoxin [Nitrospinota bacterium]